SVVFTLWLSMIAAEGSAWRPARRRTTRRHASCTRCQTPCRRHWSHVVYAVCHSGYSRGRERQAQPVRRTSKRALTSKRSGQAGGRTRWAGAGNRGASTAHSASVRSQGYREPAYTGEHGIGVVLSDRWGLAVSGTHWGAWAPSGHIVGGGWDH